MSNLLQSPAVFLRARLRLLPLSVRQMEASNKRGALKRIVQLCLWKEPGVHWRRDVSFESDEEFRSDLQLYGSAKERR